jgi:tRNA threonylcarbamoyladenosine biosynthesis protein TsaE
MVTFEWISTSPDQTISFGRMLGEMLPSGSFVALIGNLGSGKTVLAKGIAQGLGVEDHRDVTSPSFVLVHEYQGRVPVFHVDLYRLEGSSAIEEIGWDELVYGPGVTLVEWADKIVTHWPEDRIEVRLEWAEDERRKLLMIGKGSRGRHFVEELGRRWMKEG